jgi:hypothetical protein
MLKKKPTMNKENKTIKKIKRFLTSIAIRPPERRDNRDDKKISSFFIQYFLSELNTRLNFRVASPHPHINETILKTTTKRAGGSENPGPAHIIFI